MYTTADERIPQTTISSPISRQGGNNNNKLLASEVSKAKVLIITNMQKMKPVLNECYQAEAQLRQTL